YTVKLIVDGQTYSQPLLVRNDPRIGESSSMMAALRAQDKLAMAVVQGMKDSYAANSEVAAMRAQLATILLRQPLFADVATATTALDTKLATFGGLQRGGGRGPGGGGFGAPARVPGSLLSFVAVNNLFNTVLGPLSQNGIDMGPTKAELDTLQSACGEFTSTANGWKKMLDADLVDFNSLLTKNNLAPLKLMPTAVVAPASCTFTSSSSNTRGSK